MKTIGIIAPASSCPKEDQENYKSGIKFLEEQGYKVIAADNLFLDDESLGTAGTIEQRVDAFHDLWSNPEVDIVLAARGGYGCIQLLDKLDYALIGLSPKPLLGYSDITALHMAFHAKLDNFNFQTFHTPMLSEFHKWHDETKKSFLQLLDSLVPYKDDVDKKDLYKFERVSAKDQKFFEQSYDFVQKDFKERVGSNGQALEVLGGNLSVLVGLLGTEYLPDLSNAILLLEEYDEPKYKVDRMLNQLKLSGILESVAGIWVGIPEKTDFAYDVLEINAKDKKIPLIKDLPLGHGPVNLSIPLG